VVAGVVQATSRPPSPGDPSDADTAERGDLHVLLEPPRQLPRPGLFFPARVERAWLLAAAEVERALPWARASARPKKKARCTVCYCRETFPCLRRRSAFRGGFLRGSARAGVWLQRRRGTYRCLSVVSPSRHCAALPCPALLLVVGAPLHLISLGITQELSLTASCRVTEEPSFWSFLFSDQ